MNKEILSNSSSYNNNISFEKKDKYEFTEKNIRVIRNKQPDYSIKDVRISAVNYTELKNERLLNKNFLRYYPYHIRKEIENEFNNPFSYENLENIINLLKLPYNKFQKRYAKNILFNQTKILVKKLKRRNKKKLRIILRVYLKKMN